MTDPFPFISVICPTYNRAAVLPYLFDALARQLYPADRMELIVVDNSSSDDTGQVFEKWKTGLPFAARFYRKENRGPAASRNFGAARARGEILAFVDSDCIPDRAWLRNGARAFSRGAGIVCGPLIPAIRGNEGVLFHQQTPTLRDHGLYPTANLFVRRSAFEAVGGFDERYGLYPWGELIAGEDTDLAWRVIRSGARPEFRAEVMVFHLATPITLGRLLLRPIVIQIIPALLRKVPELRGTYLWMRYFNNKTHLYFYVALIAIALAVATGWTPAALLALPWVGHILFRVLLPGLLYYGPRRGLSAFAIHLYWQVGLVVVLLVASIRYRRLVL
jgi:glycosyltransferase involved in cell wall biosynthesis